MASLLRISKNISNSIGDVIGMRSEIVPDPDPRLSDYSKSAPDIFGWGVFGEVLANMHVPEERRNALKFYDFLEREIADVRKALDAYATMAVTGNLAGGGNKTYTIRPVEEGYPDELLERLDRMENLIQRHAYSSIRAMCKYGDYIPEIMLTRLSNDRIGVGNLKPIPPATVIRNVGRNGEVDPERFWVQMIDGKVMARNKNPRQDSRGLWDDGVPQWRCPHFAIWTNVVDAESVKIYGESILQPFAPIGLKVHAGLDALVVGRLTRAAMRLIWMIDVHDIKDNQNRILQRLALWKRATSRAAMLFNSNGNSDSFQQAHVPDSDYYVPAADGLKWDVKPLQGDPNVGRVGDLEMLIRFYFGALGVPPEYLGHERSQGGRSNLSQIDIQFARTCRHIQMFGASGFEHIVMVDMLLGGYDPRDYPIQIVAPPIGARDDLLQAQIRALQSTVVANLRAAGLKLDLNPRWILRTFLGMDEELSGLTDQEIAQIFEEVPDVGETPDAPTATRVKEALSKNMNDLMRVVLNIGSLLSDGQNQGLEGYRHTQPSVDDIATGVKDLMNS